MKYKIFFTLFLSCFLLRMEGKDPTQGDEPIPDPPDISLTTKLLDERISELLAYRLNVYNGMPIRELAVIEEFMEDDMMEDDGFVFPADDLYGVWDTSGVNPYRNREIAYPDSFNVDCSSFILPIDGNIKVTSKFGVRGRRMHNGIDLKVQKGDTIRTAFSGRVRIRGYERRGYGNYLVIRHPNGLETVYGHLSGFLVSENDVVNAGQPIGLGGNTGRSTGTHLHFETRFLGQALNPGNIIDFEHDGSLFNEQFVLYKGRFGKSVNIYTSDKEQIVYHRVKKGETLGKIALIYRTSVGELCRLNGLSARSVLRIGQAIRCGTTVKSNKQDLDPPKTKPEETGPVTAAYHKIQKGETLGIIANKYGTTVDELCQLNNIQTTTRLRIGQRICYRAASNPEATAMAETTQQPDSTSLDNVAVSTTTQQAPAETVYYRVKEGDTLGAIAMKHGISINRLCEMNNITRTTILRIGRSLRCS
ncbi:MAG: LysM peptidoglycan-binding domain-containing protein [Tannerella sp.]|jgi:murein DD-endopeptidase MepM/ murein hydrolase activator NlpD|nr:LysM peptidoglycan-binding domain-containing protein [Tannerella sp.]